ncbi:hypothetical protein, conserved [Leishmania donovani]|uniref:Dual specificity phosphatase, catalytic domain family protein n=1 Tax=Leishmania donovani TaxID=5661 RepID=E9BJA4_LEIDO|nr:hypothetical protein, conserved [Leishmania donovani]CBZ35331.1 hypothetical protein, conserved [Leishmania donovani]
MGNRVSTAAAPFSLEDLEALARAPSLFDTLPNDAGNSAGSGASALFRKEIIAEMERQYAECDTSLHALRCVLDRRGTRHRLGSYEATTSPAPSGGAPKAISDQGWGKQSAGASIPSLADTMTTNRSGPTQDLLQSPRELHGSRHSDPNEVADSGEAATAAAIAADRSLPNANDDSFPQRPASSRLGALPESAPAETPLSPHSWLFREVSVQPVDLTRHAEVQAAEVYVLVIVQRSTMLRTPPTSTTPATPFVSVTNTRSATPPPSSPSAATPSGAARSVATSAAMSANTNTEWPRDMVQLFTPRGLTTPFSSDMTRPTLANISHGSGASYWYSPSATPRTNGSTSDRPTPRSTTAAAAAAAPSSATGNGSGAGGFPQASPRSTSSQATPRATSFHFSVHLLTGKQADAMAAAAGLFTARAIEKLFLDCAEFDRRLFYNLNAAKVEAVIRAYSMHPTLDVTSGCHDDGSNVNAAGRNLRRSSKASSNVSGGGAASAVITGNRMGRDVSDSNSGFGTSNSSLQYLISTLRASRELRRELLAITRPSSVAVPVMRFDKRSSTATPYTTSPVSTGCHTGAFGGVSDHVTSTAVSSNPAELYSLNAIYRVLNGVRVGTPRWMHTGDVASPLNSAHYSVPGSASGAAAGGPNTSAALFGAGNWCSDPLSSFHPPRRNTHGDGAAAGAAAASGIMPPIPSLNISSWLQGPQPLNVQRAAPAGTAATGPAGSAHPTATGSTTSRMGRPLRHSWTTHSASPKPPPLLLPTLASGTPSGDCRVDSTIPPDASSAPPATLTSATSATQTPVLSLPLDSLRPAAPAAAAAAKARSTLRSASAEEGSTDASTLSPQAAAVPKLQPLINAEEKGQREKALQHTSGPARAADLPSVPRNRKDNAQLESCPAERHLHTRHQHHRADGGGQGRDEIASRHNAGTENVSTSRYRVALAPPFEDDAECNEVYNQQERAQRLKASQPEVTQVLPYLFVGGEDAARDRAQLLRKGITHIVNTVSWCIDSFYPDLFRYLTLSLSDAADEPIFSLFAVVNAFIEDAVERHQGRVFVHCQQGVSRSCTFVIAYVMWKQGLCYDRAYELVRARRNVCNPNLGFFMNLRLWEAQLSTPLLNSVFAYAPYTSTSPMPFSYQLTAYFDCETPSTVAGAVASRSSLPPSPPSPCSAEGRTLGFLSPRDKEAHQQLRSDVLTRAADMSGAPPALPNTLSLDPRLGYLFLFAPGARAAGEASSADAGRSKQKGKQRPRLSRGTDVGPGADPSGDEDVDVVTGCVVMGSQCLNKVYSERALAACRQVLRFSFYHGEARTSVTNAGKTVHFNPMRQVRLLPAISPASWPRSSSPFPVPTAAVSAEVAQRLLSLHVASQVRIRFARQSQWDALLSNTRLGAMLSCYTAEEDRLDASEGVRRHAREGATKGVGASSSGRVSGGQQTSATGHMTLLPNPLLPVNPPAPASSSFRTGRHTPRTPRQLRVSSSGNGGSLRRGSEGDRLASNAAAYSSSTGASASQYRNRADSLPAAAAGSVPEPAASEPQDVFLPSAASSAMAAVFTPSMGPAGVSLPRQGISDLSLAAAAARNGDEQAHVAVRMAEGESFAYAYPFTAGTKVAVADLDDLEEDRCYALGFQQRIGTTVYLWRGADAVESSADVVGAFVRHMLSSSEPAVQTAAVESLEAGEWTNCSIIFPGDSANAAGVAERADAVTEVLADVRALYVEQGDEPKEFFTLL